MATIDARDLKKALGTLNKIVKSRTTIPILGFVRIQKKGGNSQIEITGTDLDNELVLRLDDAGGAPGGTIDCLVQLSSLIRVARAADGDLTFEMDGDNLTIRSDGLAVDFRGLLPVVDFPAWAAGGHASATVTSEADLRSHLDRVWGCISAEATRYYLNGVYFHAPDGRDRLNLVATDGHKLALYASDIPWQPDAGRIVHTQTIDLLRSLTSERGNRPVAIRAFGGARIEFETMDFRLRAKTIDGTYPDYTRVIPDLADGVKINVPLSAVAIRKMSGLYGQSNTPVEVRPDKGEMAMRVCDGKLEMVVSSPLHGAAGEAFGMNFRNIAKMIKGDEAVVLKSKGPGEPFIVETDDPRFTGVAMPMRI